MFEVLKPIPQDPILAMMASYREDTHPQKIDLGIGVYKNDLGETPIMQAVQQAEARLLQSETTKSYTAPAGSPLFNLRSAQLVFGAEHPALNDGRVISAQTPGGCGALRMGAEFLRGCSSESRVWVSTPTWANHIPLLGGAGLDIVEYPYYDYANKAIQFDAMLQALESARQGDFILLHGCCHNPSGADLNREQWDAVADLLERKGLIPFVDMAYQGLGSGLDDDAYGVRMLAARMPEMLVATSCSKNFGLYRERTGTLFIVGETPEQTSNAGSQLFSKIRSHYSMPPSHGAAIVETILSDDELSTLWQDELSLMRHRIQGLRQSLVTKITASDIQGDFSFIEQQFGMFSFLGITPQQVEQLRTEHSIYMIDSSRMNVAGLNEQCMDYFVAALGEVLKTP
ncbi:aspartate/tyrosine/aromatic aminotransferase [Pontibacterium sp. N1Y112]|uniref:Aspartate/tyrosine/aromatic aminotransferase n=1 Tax=Pontibacterium sinense TaxID=2781979 RepID=A0A8J7FE59_9GAMM|nr:amino acid aminotransferase [Pontibacterium sinense]MBE9399407.1 aspartate/tyrosine/aromatic aminotransferase [Pontibacterium sinense]